LRVCGGNSLEQFAFSGLTRHDGEVAAQVGERAVFHIQPQMRLTLLFVRTVALKARLGKNGTDIAMEIDRRLRGRFLSRCYHTDKQAEQRSGASHHLEPHAFVLAGSDPGCLSLCSPWTSYNGGNL
jgi:hypothetical protein